MTRAAEELDRLQARMREKGEWDRVAERLESWCAAHAGAGLRGELGTAWLALVGSLDLKQHTEPVVEIARNAGLPPSVRVRACRVLGRLAGDSGIGCLIALVRDTGDPQVRAAAAEACGEVADRECRPRLREALAPVLEEELPRFLWNAVAAAVERLR
jgi:HEAT repeat protein